MTEPGKSAYSASTIHGTKVSLECGGKSKSEISDGEDRLKSHSCERDSSQVGLECGEKSKSEVSDREDQVKSHSHERDSSQVSLECGEKSKSDVSDTEDQLKSHSQDRGSSLEDSPLKFLATVAIDQVHPMLKTPKDTSEDYSNETARSNECLFDV